MSLLSRLFLVAVCLLLATGSIAVFLREYSVAYLLRGTANDQIDTLSSSSTQTFRAFSARTSRDLLSTCGRLITTAPRLKAEPDTARSVRAACGRIARDMLSRAPQNGRALAVVLLAESPALSAEALERAQKAAPFEPWPLLARLDAISAAAGTEAIGDLAGKDVARAVQSYWGRERVARLYVQRPDLQARIRDEIGKRSATDQRAFLSALRQASREAN